MGYILGILLLFVLGIISAFFPEYLRTYDSPTKKNNYGKWTEQDVVIWIWIIRIAGYLMLVTALIAIAKKFIF